MQDWYDKKVHTQRFDVGDEVFILNLRVYPKLCNKWIRRYSYTGTVVQRINDVTYRVYCSDWRDRKRIMHVDKLKLRRSKKEIDEARDEDPGAPSRQ